MKSGEVSANLPEYLQTSYTPSRTSKSPERSQKNFKTGLSVGVSSESPKFFQGSYTQVLTDPQKDQERTGEIYTPHLMLSELKKNRLSPRSTIHNMDIDSALDFHSIKMSKAIDLLANMAPSLREGSSFNKGYTAKRQEGFGLGRGECTLAADSQSVPRNYRDQLNYLQKCRGVKSAANKIPAELKQTTRLFSLSPVRNNRASQQQGVKLPSLNPIDEFEVMVKRRIVNHYDKRNMYAIEK